MRKIVLKIIVEILFLIEKVQNIYQIKEWEIYNEKYWKKELIARKNETKRNVIS